jgi:5'-deoxynucleotidase YfbR-like HD superfamily hydrolase
MTVKFHGLDKFIEKGMVRRWHTVPDLSQNVAEHSWGVAMFLIAFHPSPSAALLKAAILHDLHESAFCDIPSHIKDKYPELVQIEEAEEQLFFKRHGIQNPYDDLADDDFLWLKLADTEESIAFILSQTMKSAKHFEILSRLQEKSNGIKKQLGIEGIAA